MLTCFPVPYPEELFYSVCARYADRMAFPTKSATCRALFGVRKVSDRVGLAGNLNVLLSALPPETPLSAERIIYDHTLLPYYMPFLDPKQLIKLRDSMNNQQTARKVSSHRPFASRWLRYCPACVRDDRVRHGECYWHRVHQLPGILVCPTHAMALCESNRHASRWQDVNTFMSLERWLQSAPRGHTYAVISSVCLQTLYRLACDVQWLLRTRGIASQLEHLHDRYRAALMQRGFATHTGWVHSTALVTAAAQYYPAEVLSLLDCSLDVNKRETWLATVWRRPLGRVNVPLQHLLLLMFLEVSVTTAFLPPPTEPAPFGDSPWPCLNPVADHYRALTITRCTITYNRTYRSRPPRGEFACASCGFTYSRVGPDRTDADRLRIGRVISYGSVWDDRFGRLWNDPSIYMTFIVNHMRTTVQNLQRQARRLGLEIPSDGRRGSVEVAVGTRRVAASEDLHERRDCQRRLWLQSVAAAPDATITELRGRVGSTYDWLWCHDREWIAAHRPQPLGKRRPDPTQIEHARAAQDAEYSERIRHSVASLSMVDGRPQQVTIRGIAFHLRIPRLQNPRLLAGYPLTRAALAEVIETRRSFTIRSTAWKREHSQLQSSRESCCDA